MASAGMWYRGTGVGMASDPVGVDVASIPGVAVGVRGTAVGRRGGNGEGVMVGVGVLVGVGVRVGVGEGDGVRVHVGGMVGVGVHEGKSGTTVLVDAVVAELLVGVTTTTTVDAAPM